MLKQPKSAEELVYWTNRTIGKDGKGSIKAWVFREQCPKCKKAIMSKPTDSKGKVKIRAKEYVCPACKYTVEAEEYSDSLQACIEYICPKCGKKGEVMLPFKRKKVKIFNEEAGKEKTADALQFLCEHCKEKINVTRKMK